MFFSWDAAKSLVKFEIFFGDFFFEIWFLKPLCPAEQSQVNMLVQSADSFLLLFWALIRTIGYL
jgi:hypothetical protein